MGSAYVCRGRRALRGHATKFRACERPAHTRHSGRGAAGAHARRGTQPVVRGRAGGCNPVEKSFRSEGRRDRCDDPAGAGGERMEGEVQRARTGDLHRTTPRAEPSLQELQTDIRRFDRGWARSTPWTPATCRRTASTTYLGDDSMTALLNSGDDEETAR